MINVNQITAQLARMPDNMLQQFAAMHKTDPYTLSLALSESNRRKELRQGAQMQQQPQPKVVDQELAEMANRKQCQKMLVLANSQRPICSAWQVVALLLLMKAGKFLDMQAVSLRGLIRLTMRFAALCGTKVGMLPMTQAKGRPNLASTKLQTLTLTSPS